MSSYSDQFTKHSCLNLHSSFQGTWNLQRLQVFKLFQPNKWWPDASFKSRNCIPSRASVVCYFYYYEWDDEKTMNSISFVGYYKLLEGRGIYEDYGIQLYNYRSKTLLQELRIIFPTGWTYFSDWNWSF